MITPSNLSSRIPVVSVIERCGPAEIVVHSYPDTPEGNKLAEAHFREIAREQEMGDPPCSGIPRFHELDLENGIEEGYLGDTLGTWELYLVHSEANTVKSEVSVP